MEQNTRYHIRRMKDGDIPQVLEIDKDAFPTQWPHPTTNSFRLELRNKLAHYFVICRENEDGNTPGQPQPGRIKRIISFFQRFLDHDRFFGNAYINASGEYLVGIVGIWMMVDEAHITTIAVRSSYRRLGFGEWLLIVIIDLATSLHAHSVTLEVRVSNTVAQLLYEKYGFTIAGTRKKYYQDNHEDALIMTTDQLSSPVFQSRFQQLKEEHRTRWSHCYTLS
ncbi:MAG: ribosomal protein S18-alanine N-acetyltransferase [Dehalococcoidia bacterium]|nr:ribosomal protein S18-alanine N-acetyltransferase [Dehalococcoidia bacterium]